MKRSLFTILAALTVALCGCRHSAATDGGGASDSYAPLDPKTKVLVRGRYAALDRGGTVVVYATGMHPTSHWRTALEPDGGWDGVPSLALYGEPPKGQARQAFTPFRVSRALNARHRNAIRVRDAGGVHAVPVGPPDEPGTTRPVTAGSDVGP